MAEVFFIAVACGVILQVFTRNLVVTAANLLDISRGRFVRNFLFRTLAEGHHSGRLMFSSEDHALLLAQQLAVMPRHV